MVLWLAAGSRAHGSDDSQAYLDGFRCELVTVNQATMTNIYVCQSNDDGSPVGGSGVRLGTHGTANPFDLRRESVRVVEFRHAASERRESSTKSSAIP